MNKDTYSLTLSSRASNLLLALEIILPTSVIHRISL